MAYKRLAAFAASRAAFAIAFLWGLGEATFFFIVPDVFFLFTALFAPWQGVLHGVVSVAGTVAGGLILYQWGTANPQGVQEFLLSIPLIFPKMVAFVNESMLHDGFSAMFWGPLKGIPYKVYAAAAAWHKMDPGQFLLTTIPVRFERILLLSLAVALIGRSCAPAIRRNPKPWLVVYGCAWGIFYAFYAHRIIQQYGSP